jgi:hypothetical protein
LLTDEGLDPGMPAKFPDRPLEAVAIDQERISRRQGDSMVLEFLALVAAEEEIVAIENRDGSAGADEDRRRMARVRQEILRSGRR